MLKAVTDDGSEEEITAASAALLIVPRGSDHEAFGEFLLQEASNDMFKHMFRIQKHTFKQLCS